MKTHPVSTDRRNFLRLAGMTGFTMAAGSAYAGFGFLKEIGKAAGIKEADKILTIAEGTAEMAASTQQVDYKTEFAMGESLALEGFKRYGMPVKSKFLSNYVSTLGTALARNCDRPTIPFYFVVVESELYNAFACPGGIVFVSRALFTALETEAELAGVLAHEISHVTHRHALGAIRRAKLLSGSAKIADATMSDKDSAAFSGVVGGLQDVLFDKGLDKNLEYEADASGMDLAYRTGYNPEDFVNVLRTLKEKEKKAEKKGSWFGTHPPLRERIKRCERTMKTLGDDDYLVSTTQGHRFEKIKASL